MPVAGLMVPVPAPLPAPRAGYRQIVEPHRGAQMAFCAHSADIVVGGGQAGGGKTTALLLEPLRHVGTPGFSAVLFRRTYPQLTAAGGPWPESIRLYSQTEARMGQMRWRWPNGVVVQFSHLQHEKDRLRWKGAQIPLLLFDQLEDFTEAQFWFLLSRNRSTCGVRPYVRATCNPVPLDDRVGGWLHKLLAWWIGEDGFPVGERAGRVRHFVRVDEDLLWADTRGAARALYPPHTCTRPNACECDPKSLAFVPMRLEDNPTLLATDPGYVANLQTLPYVERMRLRHGNWDVRAVAGTLFQRHWFSVLDVAPAQPGTIRCRFWDCASTEGGGDWTVGARVAKLPDGRYVIEDVLRGQWSPAEVDRAILTTAQQDGRAVRIREEQEGGSSGKAVTSARARALAGWDYRGMPATGEKVTRWRPFAAQAEAGNVWCVRANWLDVLLRELDDAPTGVHDDQIDAVAGAFNDLATSAGVITRVKLAGF